MGFPSLATFLFTYFFFWSITYMTFARSFSSFLF